MKDDGIKVTIDSGSQSPVSISTNEVTNLLNILLKQEDPSAVPQTPCGGKGTCGKCRVRVTGQVSEPSAQELKVLKKEELEGGIRLACQTIPKGDVRVELLREPEQVQIQVEGLPVNVSLSPLATRQFVELPSSVLGDTRDDVQRFIELLGCTKYQLGLEQMATLANMDLSKTQPICAVTTDDAVADLYAIEKSTEHGVSYGLAVDIGTTTVVGYLVNLETGKTETAVSKLNAQRGYGADVLSRISYAMENEDGTQTLHHLIVRQIDDMLREIVKEKGIDLKSVTAMALAGNTTMMHFLMGLSPVRISKSPFTPVWTSSYHCAAGDLGFTAYPQCPVYLLPSVSGYVGADIVAGMLVCNMRSKDKIQLLVDIGTNGEMALSRRGDIISCSVAAGPAFEGARIKCGVGGVAGAIDAVWMEGDEFHFSTLFKKMPIGICGSGLVDIIALLVEYGMLDEGGRFTEKDEWDPRVHSLEDRIQEIEGQTCFVVAWSDSAKQKPVYISQQDVREVQLAKAAVQAGIKTLLKHTKTQFEDVDTLWLAGGFGNKLQKESAVIIGLLPKELESKIAYAGNTSGSGTIMALLSGKCRTECDIIKKETRYLELSGLPGFNDVFIDAIGF